MTHSPNHPHPDDQGFTNEALSNEVLMLKIDDLFQEMEQIKRRLERLEGQADRGGAGEPERQSPPTGMVSDPDRR